jgi:hypothetical protein
MKLEQLKKMIREIAKKEMLKEEEINWKAVQNTQKSLKLESASRTAMEIGGLTGLNKDVVQKFVDTHNLDIEKVFQFVKKGKLSDRMDFVTAVSGKPNNPIQKKMIKMFGESVNEEIKVGQMVKVVDNPHWEAALGKKGPFKRKVKMIDGDNVFFTDGSNSSMKYIKESVNEATNLAKMMAGIKKGSQTGPWTIVVSFNKKVYYQTQVKTKNEIPAKFEHMKKVTNIPGYIFTIEDNTGMTVYSEKLLNESIKAFDERSFGKNGIIIMIDDNGKKVSVIFKNRKNADKYNRNKPEDLKTLVSLANKKGFGKAIDESINEDKIDWAEFYKMAKDTSGYNPNFEKKYGKVLDRPHVADAVKKAKDFKSFMQFIQKYESVNEGKYDADLDKIEAAVKNASSFMNIGAELKKAGIKYDFSTEMIPMYIIKVSGNTIAIVNKKYAAGAEREVGNYAIVLMKFQNLVKEAKKYDIGSGYLGNGLTIWNRAEEKDGDYETIAHIGKDGKLTIYDKEIPADIKKMIGIWATSMKKGNRPGSY